MLDIELYTYLYTSLFTILTPVRLIIIFLNDEILVNLTKFVSMELPPTDISDL